MELLSDGNTPVKALVYEMSYGLTIEKAMTAPKLFQVKRKLGIQNLLKLVAVIIKSFCDSIKAGKTMDAVDVLECSELICERYTHDSVKDIVMALKLAKMKGMSFYNVVNTAVVFEIIEEYMNKKSGVTETIAADFKANTDGSVNTESYSRYISEEAKFERQKEANEMKELGLVLKAKSDMERIKNDINKSLEGGIK